MGHCISATAAVNPEPLPPETKVPPPPYETSEDQTSPEAAPSTDAAKEPAIGALTKLKRQKHFSGADRMSFGMLMMRFIALFYKKFEGMVWYNFRLSTN
jgi:hypothetical protein